MNEFVNYQKRGVELPPGCKNLIDVLGVGPPQSWFGVEPLVSEVFAPAEGLIQLEHYLSRLLQPPTRRRSLWIISLAIPFSLGLVHGNGVLRAMIFLPAACEASVRAILNKEGLLTTQDDPIGGGGLLSRIIVCALPTEPTEAMRLVSELLRSGYGLPEDVQLVFDYREKDAGP